VANSTSNSAAIFSYDWPSNQFTVGPEFSVSPTATYPYDAVMRPRSNDEVWVCGASGDGVVVVDATGSIIKEIPTGEYPVSIAFNPDQGIALVSCRNSNRLDIIDIDEYVVIGSLPIPGDDPGNIIYDPRGHRFFLVEWYGEKVFTIAPDGSAILDQAVVGDSLWQLVIDPNIAGYLFVTDRGTDQVRVLNPDTLEQTTAVDVGDDPWGLDVDDFMVIVSCEDSHDVYRIDITDWSVDQMTLSADADPRDVNIVTGLATTGLPGKSRTLLGGAAYVCGGNSSAGNLVHVLDIYNFTIIDTIVVPGTNTNVVAVEAQWPLPSAVEDLPGAERLQFHAAPNPFNPRTTFSFMLEEAAEVTLAVFDLRGNLVRRMEAGTMAAGAQHIEWEGTNRGGQRVASGSYVAMVQAGDMLAQTKVVLVQ
jgi:YVTN family beta-propeller protein